MNDERREAAVRAALAAQVEAILRGIGNPTEHETLDAYRAVLPIGDWSRIAHHPTCSPDYPEKPRDEPARMLIVDEEAGVVTCADCGACVTIPVRNS